MPAASRSGVAIITCSLLVLLVSSNPAWGGPLSGPDLVRKGKISYQRGDFAGAAEAFTTAINLDKSNFDALLNRASALSKMDRVPEALRDLNQAIALHPKSGIAHASRGLMQLRLRRIDLASKDCTMAVRLDPGSADVHELCGIVYAEADFLSQALRELTIAIKLNPHAVGAYIYRSDVHLKLEDLNSALKDIEAAMKVSARNPDLYIQRGIITVGLGKYDAAVEDYNRALAIAPGNPKALHFRGLAYASKGLPHKAVEDFSAALVLNPRDISSLFERGQMFLDMEQYDKAIADFSEFIKLNPGIAAGFVRRATAYEAIGRDDLAHQDYVRGLKVDPRDPYALLHVESNATRRNEYAERLKRSTRLLKWNSREPRTLFDRAMANLLSGNDDAAARDLQSILKLTSPDSDTYETASLLLHLAYLRDHKNDAARKCIDDALSVSKRKEWPHPVLQFIAGQKTERELLALAGSKDRSKMTIVRNYIAWVNLMHGNKTAALRHFRWVAANGDIRLDEYLLCLDELHRLNASAR